MRSLNRALLCTGLVVGGWVSFGCTSHPTVGDALNEIFDAACTRIQQCNPSGFATEFPKGEPSCVSQLVDSSTQDQSAETACSSDEIDTCTKDIKAMTCEQFATLGNSPGVSGLPASCQKC